MTARASHTGVKRVPFQIFKMQSTKKPLQFRETRSKYATSSVETL